MSKPSTGAKCPICGKPAQAQHQPFCSARCVSIDLNRWLSEAYVVRGDEVAPAAGTDPEAENDDE